MKIREVTLLYKDHGEGNEIVYTFESKAHGGSYHWYIPIPGYEEFEDNYKKKLYTTLGVPESYSDVILQNDNDLVKDKDSQLEKEFA